MLASTLLKRANEASGIYQMFENLGDVVIISRHKKTFDYLEEFPLQLVDDLSNRTGHEFFPHNNSLLILSMEYGHNFSQVGRDVFKEGDAEERVQFAHKCNFLHPVIYFYNSLPTAQQMQMKGNDTMPQPDGIHHVVEDFTTIFDTPTAHQLPLRRFLEFVLDEDLRHFHSQTYVEQGLTCDLERNEKLPIASQKYLESETSVFHWM